MRPRPPRLLALVLPFALAAGPLGASVQEVDPPSDSLAALDVPALLEEGQMLHDRLLPLDALHRFEAVVQRDSRHYEARWKAAREAVNVGMLASDDDRKKEWFRRAERHARVGMAARDSAPDARHWLSVALGRRALLEGIRTRVRIAGEVRDLALRVLEVDSLHHGAHHVLGQWHAEVRRLSGIERWIAGNVLGGDAMDEASWEEARKHLERAVELAPGHLLHRLELARIYLDLDREDDARTQLEEVLRRPAMEPTDPLHKQAAQELLEELG